MDDHSTTISGYDASQDSGARGTLIFPTNSRVEHSRTTRRRLLEKNRALEANFAFATRLRSKFGRCVAGTGIFPNPVTRDLEWNAAAKDFFERWASNPDAYAIDGSRDLWEDQRLCAEELGAGDGEFFEARVKVDGLPYVQPLDPFEVESPGDARRMLFQDGIRTDAYLRPTTYAVCELAAPGVIGAREWREIARRDMVHVFKRRRAKQLRALPTLYSSLNDGNDALDTLALEKASTKLHALLAVAKVTKPENKGQGLSNQLKKVLNDDGVTSRLEEKFDRGASIVELSENEDLKLLTSTRPSSPVVEGVKLYCALMALGADLPFSVVWSFAGMSGAPTRAELEDAQGTFEMTQDRVVWRQSQPNYVWRMAIAQETGELPRCRDPYWWRCDWHGPAKITVDLGRTADANIKLTRNGMLSHPRYFEERGQDANTEMKKQIAFLVRLREQCDAADIPIEWILEPTPGAMGKGTEKAGSPKKKAASTNEGGDQRNEPSESSDSKKASESLSGKIDAYGVAVRAGAITPTIEDEEAFRAEAGFPALSEPARSAWREDGGFRRPITLVQKAASSAPSQNPSQSEE